MARPRKTKNRNGTGTVTTRIQKIDRKQNRLKTICKICGECNDMSICNNRIGTQKCKKCLECNGKDCDRFYVYKSITALSPNTNGNRKYLGQFNNKTSAQEKIIKVKNGGFLEKSKITLDEILQKNDMELLKINKINQNTFNRRTASRNKIKKSGIGNYIIQNIKTKDIQNFMASLINISSQSDINKIKDELNSGFKYAMEHKLLLQNPMDEIKSVESNLAIKIARPFELEEQNLLLEYIENEPYLTDIRSTMDSITFKNIVKLSFACGQRIGELLALIYDKPYNMDVNFKRKCFYIHQTITRDTKGKFILGNRTKNSKKRLKRGLSDYRQISFNIAPDDIIENIFKEQIAHSETFKNNTQHFIFCNNSGNFITSTQVTTTLKRICRKLGIQLDYEKGCHIHQARHSFVTRCLEASMKAETIANLIGDNVEQVQKTYGHILERFKQDELLKLHKYYENKKLKF